jgi:CubicO group peptidase (beta-lactamase class C family)
MLMRALLALLIAAPAFAQDTSIIGASTAEFSAWMKRLDRDQRIAFLDACWDGKSVRLSAFTLRDGRPSEVRYGLTSADQEKLFKELTGKGFRLLSLRGYADGTGLRFASVWVKDNSGVFWSSWPELTPQEYQTTFERESRRGMWPAHVAGFPVEGSHRLSTIFQAGDENAFQARHDLTAGQLTTTLEEMIREGYRPRSVSGYSSGERTLYAAVFIGDHHASVARHDLTPAECREQDRKLARSGYHLASISGYLSSGELRYAVVWMREKPSVVKDRPITGKAVAGLEAFDRAMLQFMKERNIPGGTLAVSKDGKLLLSRGYGFSDRDWKKPMAPDTPMRLASIGKSITAAAIRKLVREDKLSLDTRAFVLLDVKPPPGAKVDPRLKQITIGHLLDHQGGWDRETTFDPMFRAVEIAADLKKDPPASADEVVTWMMGQPLQFDPGSRTSYSNFGYCVLGRVVQKVTGKTYVEYVRGEVLKAPGITSVEQARSLPGMRNPREPHYFDPHLGPSVFPGKLGKLVPTPDGTFHLETMDAHGGLIGSAPDLAKFLDAYWLNGQPRRGGTGGSVFFGSIPGTWTMLLQRSDGLNVAVLFNQRADSSGLKYELIREAMDRAAESMR